MKRVISLLLVLTICISLLAGCGGNEKPKSPGGESDGGKDVVESKYPTKENPVTLKFGHVSPDSSDMHANAVQFKNKVEEKTDGAIKIEIYPNAQLGGEDTMLDSIFSDTMDMGMISSNVASTVIPQFNGICLPFFFDSFEQAASVIRDERYFEKTAEVVEAKGIHFVGIPLMAARGILNTKKLVTSPADLKGLKIRVNSGSIIADTFDAMGVTTTQLPFGEVYTAMQQNVIDGLDNGIFASNLMKFTEVGKYYTNSMHYFQLSPLLVSDKTWNMISDDQKVALREACKEVEAILVDEANNSDAAAYVKAEEEYKVEIHHLSSEEFQTFRDLVDPVYKKYIPLIGEDYYQLLVDLKK